MMAIIAIGLIIGQYLDEKYEVEEKYFTLVFTLVFVMISLYYVLKGFIHKS